jgi:hypothetical protein
MKKKEEMKKKEKEEMKKKWKKYFTNPEHYHPSLRPIPGCIYPEEYNADEGDTRTFKSGEKVCIRSEIPGDISVMAAKYIEHVPSRAANGVITMHRVRVMRRGTSSPPYNMAFRYHLVGKREADNIHPAVKAVFKTGRPNNPNNNSATRRKRAGREAMPENVQRYLSNFMGGGRRRLTRKH